MIRNGDFAIGFDATVELTDTGFWISYLDTARGFKRTFGDEIHVPIGAIATVTSSPPDGDIHGWVRFAIAGAPDDTDVWVPRDPFAVVIATPRQWKDFQPLARDIADRVAAANMRRPEPELIDMVAVASSIAESFLDIDLNDTEIFADGLRADLHGTTAHVQTSGQINSRITATRLALLGPFAIAARKKSDDRQLFLTIENAALSVVRALDPRGEQDARTFAAHLNQLGAATPPPPPAASSSAEVFEQLRQLGELHAAGIVSDAEFAAKKAELLSRI